MTPTATPEPMQDVTRPLLSVVIPAYREAPNIEPLVRRIHAAVAQAGIDFEIIIVDDDSRDGTETVVAALSPELPVRLMVRRDERGLSSAVIHGFRHARGALFVIMDADLQHPPEAIPSLVDPIRRGAADMVVGSRYAPGGRIVGRWSAARRINSMVATWLARPLVRLSDPMSGFCALRRDVWERAVDLNPIGFKIVLELAARSPGARIAEVPITFAQRHAGTTKLTVREQLRYLRQVSNLMRQRFLARH